MVEGSLTTPLSYFFTALTSAACSSIELFLCRIPIPPFSASAIAMAASVTVSIAADTRGIFNEMFLETFVSN